MRILSTLVVAISLAIPSVSPALAACTGGPDDNCGYGAEDWSGSFYNQNRGGYYNNGGNWNRPQYNDPRPRWNDRPRYDRRDYNHRNWRHDRYTENDYNENQLGTILAAGAGAFIGTALATFVLRPQESVPDLLEGPCNTREETNAIRFPNGNVKVIKGMYETCVNDKMLITSNGARLSLNPI